MWSMRSWHITRVFLNGASLHDHKQTHIYNSAVNASSRRARSGVWAYESTRVRYEPDAIPKREYMISTHSTNDVSSKVSCQNNCVQPFLRAKILAIWTQIDIESSVYFCKHRLLDVHSQIHRDVSGKEKIILEGIEVCLCAWWTIHKVSKATFYRYKEKAKVGIRAKPHDNLSTKKPRLHIV